jgi:hypothetical protein
VLALTRLADELLHLPDEPAGVFRAVAGYQKRDFKILDTGY